MKASYNDIIAYKQSRVWNKNGTDYIANSSLELTVTKGTVIPIETMGGFKRMEYNYFVLKNSVKSL